MTLRVDWVTPRFVFRKRCGWCGVVLRGWQINLCRMCHGAATESCVRTSPCVQGSRWDEAPDNWLLSWWST